MGRTLHFKVWKENGSNFTKTEEKNFRVVSKAMNSDKFENVWSCENFWIDNVSLYPNWDLYGTYELFKLARDSRYEQLKRDGVPQLEQDHILLKEGIYSGEIHKKEFTGFVKVAGNEYNAMLVYEALLSVSRLCPKIRIRLSDEGEYLLFPLFIQNGKVFPDFDEIKKNIEYWSYKGFVNSKSKNATLLKKLIQDDDLKRELGLNNSYEDYIEKNITKYANKITVAMHLLKEHLSEQATQSNWGRMQFNFHNINNIDSQYWLNPKLFVRPVDPKQFEGHEWTQSNYLSGFDGEAFGLADPEDAEFEGYKMLSSLQKMVGNTGKLILASKDVK